MLNTKIFTILIILLAGQRLFELFWSRRNEKILKNKGGFEVAHEHFIWMKLLHLTWLCSTLFETWFFKINLNITLTCLSLGLFLLGQVLRLSAIFTLKERWTASIMILPKVKVINKGIYKYLRHPNYLGVVLEIAFFPLIGGAVVTSIIFSFLNFIILKIRLSNEEAALSRYC